MADKTPDNGQPVVIKKYANRRLYNTASSSYVTLEHLCQMVKDEIEFVVLDAKVNDITQSVLTQIIVEEEAKGVNLMTLRFLRHLISFYGDSVQRMLLPHYLEYSIDAFAKKQEDIQQYMEGAFGNMFSFGQVEKMGKKNLKMMELAMQMFSPFEPLKGKVDGLPEAQHNDSLADIQSLQSQLNAMQAQLNKMNDGS